MKAQTPPSPDEVGKACEKLGFSFSSAQGSGSQITAPETWLEDLTAYLAMVQKWNKVMNLVGPSSWQSVLSTLIIDSFHLSGCIAKLPLPEHPVCRDLGAGAGLPGIPLRILWQQGVYSLVEVREKRSLFLKTFLAARPLPGVDVFQGRAEDFMASRPHADLTVSRAFLPWEQVLALIDPYTDAQAFCIFLTLTPPPSQLPQNWRVFDEFKYTAGKDTRFFWILRKE